MSKIRAGGVYDEWRNMGFKRNPANRQEQSIENMYIRLLTDLAASRFKWTNMPDEIDLRYLELTLFYQALSVFYYDGRYDKYMALRANINGHLDYQNNPTGFNVIGNNFNSISVSAIRDTQIFLNTENGKDKAPQRIGQGIPIWANKQRIPDIDIVLIYAKKLANLDRTVEINSNNARMPKAVVSNEASTLTMANISRQIEEGQNNIKVRGNVNLEDIKAIDLGVDPLTILNIDIVRDRQWNKCMTLLGIQSSNQDKKERLVSDEVTANGDQTSMMRFVNLNERRAAVEKINKKYKLEIEVEYYTDEERQALGVPQTGTPTIKNSDGDDDE
jgi:Nuclear protein with HMG-like acidic region